MKVRKGRRKSGFGVGALVGDFDRAACRPGKAAGILHLLNKNAEVCPPDGSKSRKRCLEPYKTAFPTDLNAENVVRNRTKYISVRFRIRKSYFVTVSEDFRMATGSKLLFLPPCRSVAEPHVPDLQSGAGITAPAIIQTFPVRPSRLSG